MWQKENASCHPSPRVNQLVCPGEGEKMGKRDDSKTKYEIMGVMLSESGGHGHKSSTVVCITENCHHHFLNIELGSI
jgi:hypothetical protein